MGERMPLTEEELANLRLLEKELRTDDPLLDRSLRRMMSPEDSTSMWLTLSVLGGFAFGLALLVTGWVLLGLVVLVAGVVGPLRWASRRFFHPECHHLVPDVDAPCPRCTAS
ncbi:DUF3040 domain-containing protein [Saccharomonospora glauca]|uniref:DUF3040 domain-containing protein n=1 Tax=Saccharomonospora glauca K62 TaxID=928724 RepID=I1D246_9PSEU|nr:DUF3040 domain-containing protein [Saccharomonospora glauca]EIE99020.1 Protein of unknown function (DUF3040) [Saccharomonospora glauca K62]